MRDRQTLGSLVLFALLLYSLLSFASARRRLSQAESYRLSLSRKIETQQSLCSSLEERLRQGYSQEELRQMARERLGLVLPGERSFYFSDREV